MKKSLNRIVADAENDVHCKKNTSENNPEALIPEGDFCYHITGGCSGKCRGLDEVIKEVKHQGGIFGIEDIIASEALCPFCDLTDKGIGYCRFMEEEDSGEDSAGMVDLHKKCRVNQSYEKLFEAFLNSKGSVHKKYGREDLYTIFDCLALLVLYPRCEDMHLYQLIEHTRTFFELEELPRVLAAGPVIVEAMNFLEPYMGRQKMIFTSLKDEVEALIGSVLTRYFYAPKGRIEALAAGVVEMFVAADKDIPAELVREKIRTIKEFSMMSSNIQHRVVAAVMGFYGDMGIITLRHEGLKRIQ